MACIDIQKKQPNQQDSEKNTPLNFIDNLTNLVPDLNDNDLISLMVINGNLCSSCTNEIIEYNEVIEEYVNSPLNDRKIYQHLIVLGIDESDRKRILNQLGISINSDFININSEFGNIYYELKPVNMSENQLMLLDIKNKKILSRVGIYTSSTGLYYKKNLINENFTH